MLTERFRLSGRAGATGFSKPLWWNGSARKKRADKKNPGCDCIRDFLGKVVSLDRHLQRPAKRERAFVGEPQVPTT